MKKSINRILARFGYRITRISKFASLRKSVAGTAEDFSFVQIGANDGQRFDSLFEFVTGTRSNGLVVEPLPDFYERLALNYKNYPAVRPVRYALHPTLNSCPIYRVDPKREQELPPWAAGIASFLPDHHVRLGIPSEFIVTEDVPCISLMELLRSEGITQLDLLQIDTEGFDAEIIGMIDFEEIQPRLLKYEHANLSASQQASAAAILRAQGYRMFREGGDTVGYLK